MPMSLEQNIELKNCDSSLIDTACFFLSLLSAFVSLKHELVYHVYVIKFHRHMQLQYDIYNTLYNDFSMTICIVMQKR